MSSGKKTNERKDAENPEWTATDITKARSAAEVLSSHMDAKAIGELLQRRRGRPVKEGRKVNQTLRIDPDVLEAYKRKGKGWQTVINAILRQNMPSS